MKTTIPESERTTKEEIFEMIHSLYTQNSKLLAGVCFNKLSTKEKLEFIKSKFCSQSDFYGFYLEIWED